MPIKIFDEGYEEGKHMSEGDAERVAQAAEARSHEIPVSPNRVPPSGCPKNWIRSTEECGGPTNSSVCTEFCPLGQSRQERHFG